VAQFTGVLNTNNLGFATGGTEGVYVTGACNADLTFAGNVNVPIALNSGLPVGKTIIIGDISIAPRAGPGRAKSPCPLTGFPARS